MTPEFSFDDLQQCAERELRMRKRVYGRWVSEGRIKQAWADREIAMMEEIANHLKRQALGERLL